MRKRNVAILFRLNRKEAEALDKKVKKSGLSREELTAHLEPSRYIGRCPEQVEEFLKEEVEPVLERYPHALEGKTAELKV